MKKLVYLFLFIAAIACDEEGVNSSSTDGINGSYSQVIVYGDYLYGLSDNQLSTVDISDKDDARILDEQILDFDIESIYRYENLLFIGSPMQMYIFSIGTNGIPRLNSETDYFFEEIVCRPSDPIVTDETFAYVTLHVERNVPCVLQNWEDRVVNELQIYDIRDIGNPKFIQRYELDQPKGLAKKGDYLFICDTWNVKILNVRHPTWIRHVNTLENTSAYDVIIKDDILLVVGGNEFTQFDISDINNITELSRISF